MIFSQFFQEKAMTLADQFARLVAKSGSIATVTPLIVTRAENTIQKSRTVYSIGEAINYQGIRKNAKLATGAVRD
jgi:hypothetical protein